VGRAQHVISSIGDRGQGGPAAGHVTGHGNPGRPPQIPHQGGTFAEKPPGPLYFERHQRPELRPGRGGGEVTLGDPEPLHVLGRQVDAASPEILRHVLPVLGELQGGADPVGEDHPLRRGRPEHVQHDAAHRVGREPAVAGQIAEGGIPADHLVLPVGPDQVREHLLRDRARPHYRRQRADHPDLRASLGRPRVRCGWRGNRLPRGLLPQSRILKLVKPTKVGFQCIQQLDPFSRGCFIAHVVHGAGEAVDRFQAAPVPAR
jgi:hypothetical protein